jgi:hypothetical protein
MPYKSTAQRAYMHIHHPQIAKRWDKEYGGKPVATTKNVPQKAQGVPFSGKVLQRALARRTAPAKARGGVRSIAPVKSTGPVKAMPSGRAIPSPRSVGGGVRSIPGAPGSNIKPSKARQGGSQLQAMARRAAVRRRRRPSVVARAYD